MRKCCNCIWTYVTFTWFWFSFLLVEVEIFYSSAQNCGKCIQYEIIDLERCGFGFEMGVLRDG